MESSYMDYCGELQSLEDARLLLLRMLEHPQAISDNEIVAVRDAAALSQMLLKNIISTRKQLSQEHDSLAEDLHVLQSKLNLSLHDVSADVFDARRATLCNYDEQMQQLTRAKLDLTFKTVAMVAQGGAKSTTETEKANRMNCPLTFVRS